MEYIISMITKTVLQVWTTFTHNWPFLIVSIFIAVCLKLFLDPGKVSVFLMRYRKLGVVGSTVAAVTTPLCSCGTTAIILGMMASTIPWAPIIAFMVSSPLTSPGEVIYSAGLFGWPFAVAFFGSSIVLGLVGGFVGDILERRGWLANQSRFAPLVTARNEPKQRPVSSTACACDSKSAQGIPARSTLINRPAPVLLASVALAGETGLSQAICCSSPVPSSQEPCDCSETVHAITKPSAYASEMAMDLVVPACACEADQTAPIQPTVTLRLFISEAFSTGKRLLMMFFGFAFIGYFLNGLIPSEWFAGIFGPGNTFSVPLAATLGLPLYINTEGSLPLVRALIDGGMSQGAAMAFLISGAGTSIGAFTGALTIARWRVIAIVIGTLWLGAIAMGYLYNFLLISGLF